MDGIEKLDNVTWYGHCLMHVMAALNEAKLDFCQQRALTAAWGE